MPSHAEISRKRLHLSALLGVLCVLAGCIQADGNLQQQLTNLRNQRICLDKKLIATKKAIGDAKGNSGLTRDNQIHLNRISENLARANLLNERSRDFWLNHQAVFMEREHEDAFSKAGLNGRLCFGTPFLVSTETTTRTYNDKIAVMPMEGAAAQADKPIPMGSAKIDVCRDQTPKKVLAESKNTPIEAFAEMASLNLPKADSCLIMDNALGPMPMNCNLDGFSLLLEPQAGGGKPLLGKTIALVVMSKDSQPGKMRIERKQTIRLVEDDTKVVTYGDKREDGRYMLRVFFGDEYDALPIRKEEYWALKIPTDAKIPCDYLGFPEGLESPVLGGDIHVAVEDESEALQFVRPDPTVIPTQTYAPAGCVYDEKVLQGIGAWEADVRKTLKPAISMAVYGTVDAK